MQTADLVEGAFYAFREKRTPGTPLLKVKLLAKVGRKGHVRIRYETGPHPGLEEYVATRQLVVPWVQQKAFLRDEERYERIRAYSAGRRPDALVEAVATVLGASGEPSAYATVEGLSMPVEEVERIMRRAGLEGDPVGLHPLAFEDRLGDVHVPFEGTEALARAFAAAEPENVLMAIRDHEEELRIRGNQPGQRYVHDLLRQYLPGWAIARQWAGFDKEIEEMQKEIGRLRGLVSSAAYDLKALGADAKARKLLRALEGG